MTNETTQRILEEAAIALERMRPELAQACAARAAQLRQLARDGAMVALDLTPTRSYGKGFLQALARADVLR